jgi:peroxiredoxin Q/BCP
VLQAFEVVWFMASTDDAATNRKFAEANQANFPVLADPDGEVAERYGVLKLGTFAARWTFYIDPAGKIAYIDQDVNPLTAGADAAKRLGLLGVPPRQ